jgi:RNA exonuclease 1
LIDIQSALRCLIDAQTILIGHSLDTDLKVLQIVHCRVIDSSALYPHASGLPYKIALKTLTKDLLGVDIQDCSGEALIYCILLVGDITVVLIFYSDGHDSAEDAIAALQLVLLKVSMYVY